MLKGKAQRGLAVLRATARRLAVLRLTALLVSGGALLALLAATSIGAYLDDVLFVKPTMQLRARLDRQPRLDPRVRLVVFDDRSFSRLKRAPTFAEWRVVADHLFRLGYERVLYDAIASEDLVGEASPPGGLFAAGAADYRVGGASRDEVVYPAELFLAGSIGALPASTSLLAPPATAQRAISRLGALNVVGESSMPIGYRIERGQGAATVMPNLAFWAATELRIEQGRLWHGADPFPMPSDGLAYFDFVRVADAMKSTTQVAQFFTKDAAPTVALSLEPRLVERLKGGKVAVLIPDGRTGARFHDSPTEGKVAAYVGFVSLVNDVLHGRLLHRPWPAAGIVMLSALFWATLLAWRRSSRAIGVAAVAIVAVFAGGALALELAGWLLPVAQVGLLGILAIAVCASHTALQTYLAKARIEGELAVGRAVQSLFLPSARAGSFGEWEYRVSLNPYGEMSGDWLQLHLPAADGEAQGFGIVAIGDVVGKGVSAALNTALIATVWGDLSRRFSPEALSSEELMKSLDVAMNAAFRGEQFSTLAYARLGPAAIELTTLASPRWITLKGDAPPSVVVTPRGNPIGMLGPTWKLKATRLAVEPGQCFVAFTDGVIDGGLSLAAFVSQVAALSLPDDFESLFTLLHATALATGAASALPDDRTFVLIRRRPAAVRTETARVKASS